MKYTAPRLALVFSLCIFCGSAARADERDREVQKKKDLIKKVSTRLLAVADPVPGLEWPPVITYLDSPKINADASVMKKDGRLYPTIRVFDGIMTNVIKGDEDRL